MHSVCFSSTEWKMYSEHAHLAVFGELRPKEMDRIDFCIVIEKENLPMSYATIRELDSETAYMQYGGAFPSSEKSVKAFDCYILTISELKKKNYKRISTLIENKNIPMIKFALKCGFLIVGIRTFENKIYCEFLKEFKEE